MRQPLTAEQQVQFASAFAHRLVETDASHALALGADPVDVDKYVETWRLQIDLAQQYRDLQSLSDYFEWRRVERERALWAAAEDEPAPPLRGLPLWTLRFRVDEWTSSEGRSRSQLAKLAGVSRTHIHRVFSQDEINAAIAAKIRAVVEPQ